jgi:acyl-coenzyme A thioesterase PaaI-like protein
VPSRRELIAQFFPHSPLVAHLGMRLESIGTDEAVLVLPFRPELATIGDTVHGGAIASSRIPR